MQKCIQYLIIKLECIWSWFLFNFNTLKMFAVLTKATGQIDVPLLYISLENKPVARATTAFPENSGVSPFEKTLAILLDSS